VLKKKISILSSLRQHPSTPTFVTRQSTFDFSDFLFRSDRPLFWPAAGLKPCMKLHHIRCHFQEISHRRDRGDRRDYLKFSFSAFSAFSAVNCYVSFSIKLAAFQAGGWADFWLLNSEFQHRLTLKALSKGKPKPGSLGPDSSLLLRSFLK